MTDIDCTCLSTKSKFVLCYIVLYYLLEEVEPKNLSVYIPL